MKHHKIALDLVLLLLVAAILAGAPVPVFARPEKIAVTGSDVMFLLGTSKGSPLIGNILKDVEQKIIDMDMANDRNVIIDYIKGKYVK